MFSGPGGGPNLSALGAGRNTSVYAKTTFVMQKQLNLMFLFLFFSGPGGGPNLRALGAGRNTPFLQKRHLSCKND